MLNKIKKLHASQEEGFTLIELLVVIMIIGILAALALPIFAQQQRAALRANMKAEVRNTIAAIQTQLVKHPKSTIAESDTGYDYYENGVVYIHVIDEEPNEIEIKRSGYIVGPATWDNYTVKAEMEDGSSEWEYMYSSLTGKFIEKEE